MAKKKRHAGKNKGRGSAKRSISPQQKKKLIVWIRHGALVGVSFMFLAWLGALFFASNADVKLVEWARTKGDAVSVASGFSVKNFLVEGRKNSDPDVLLALINVREGDSIFSLKPEEAKEQIERISWVKSVRVERRLPDTIYVRIEERTPVALWHHKEKLSLIDSEGVLLTQQNLDQFQHLPMVRGNGAQKKAGAFIELLQAEPLLEQVVDHADYVEKRRWDLYLKNGKRIKLPESNIGLALRNVMVRHEQDKILEEEAITIIDARYEGRLIVRTKLGKVQKYKAGVIESGTPL